jgi:hypothetical protein
MYFACRIIQRRENKVKVAGQVNKEVDGALMIDIIS